MENTCVGCLRLYETVPGSYETDGNFCRPCVMEINMRLEMKTQLAAEKEGRIRYGKKDFKTLKCEYESMEPTVSFEELKEK